MKKHVWTFGSIAGIIVSTFMGISMFIMSKNPDSDHGSGSMVLGYATMLVAFIFIFVGIRSFRDKKQAGVITFGKAFKLGVLIALVASTFYVVTWAIEYNLVMPDFMEKYSQAMMRQAKESGASEAKLAETAAEMEKYREWYKNPIMFVLFTYLEVFPVGLLVAAISALILRRKTPTAIPA